jgi:hypothetical protein
MVADDTKVETAIVDEGIPHGMIAITPPGIPNLIITVISPVIALLVRFAFTFGTQFVGLLTAAMTPDGGRLLNTGDFLHLLVTCASLSLPGAILDLAKNAVTLTKKLEGKYPLLTGSI